MKPKTFYLITYGCQMNQSDSERIMAVMKKMGFKEVPLDMADILIFNLCSVRQSAVDRVWGMLPKATNNKQLTINNQQKRQSLVVLTGCILEADKKKFKDKVDLILEIKDLTKWPGIIKTFPPEADPRLPSAIWRTGGQAPSAEKHKNIKTINSQPFGFAQGRQLTVNKKQDNPHSISPLIRGRVLEAKWLPERGGKNREVKQNNNSDYFSVNPLYQSEFSAYVPIMTGCNNYCSYCVVPYTRGKEESRPAGGVLKEVNNLVVQGYKEIILLGQNVNSYQSKTQNTVNKKQEDVIHFPDLLKLIDQISGNYWLSFITSHPKDMSEELIKCFKECQHLMPYLHLPVQSGSDRILKKINRGYTIAHYKKLIRVIRQSIRGISISTDVIVGFPGETERDFQKTVKLMKWAKFDMAYIAEYSPRPGTTAAKLKDNVPPLEKARRRKILNEILEKTALERNKKMIGKEVDVLVENISVNQCSHQCESVYYGKTRNFKHVKITINKKQLTINKVKEVVGQFIKVKITSAGLWGLSGEKSRNCLRDEPRNGRGDVCEANRRALGRKINFYRAFPPESALGG